MRSAGEKIKRGASAVRTAVRSGAGTTFATIVRKFREKRDYRKWLEKFGAPDEPGRQHLRELIDEFDKKPLISILLPVYDVDEKWLRLCVESVFKQIYTNWELCIADDNSPKPHVRRILEEYAATDERIKLVLREANGHISAASNTALELATGEFTVLLDHDDELAEDALFWVLNELNTFPRTMMIYSDEDLIDENGRRYAPKFKPDWSCDLFYSVNTVTHLSAYRTSLLRELGGFRTGFEGSQDYDLALRVIEKIDEGEIRHIPRILYHWRVIRGSVAYAGGEKPYAHERARNALREHFEKTGKRATVTQVADDLHRVRYQLPEPPPKVSLILVADDADIGLKRAAEYSLLTQYPNFEIVLIAKNSPNKKPGKELRFVVNLGVGKAEALNLAARQCNCDVLCFADVNLLPQSDDWLTELAGFAIQDEIGAAGGKVLSENETIKGTGLIIGATELVGIAHEGFPGNSPGNMARNRLIGNYTAISISCMVIRRNLFDQAGGFDFGNLPNTLFDADLCLRLREKGLRIVFTPYAELFQNEVEKRPSQEKAPAVEESGYFENKWREVIRCDPFYNPNLSKKDASFSIDI